MYSLTAAIMTPWALKCIQHVLAVIPEVDDPSILESKTLRDQPSKNMMELPKGMAMASGGCVSSTELAAAKMRTMQPNVVGVHRVTVKMKAMQQVVDIVVRAAEKTNGFMDASIIRGRDIVTGSCNSDM